MVADAWFGRHSGKHREVIMSFFDRIYLRSEAESRSITAENPTGARARGAMEDVPPWSGQGWNPARELGRGFKVRPCISLEPGSTTTLMDTEGPGILRHIWVTLDHKFLRDVVLRVYWDGQSEPSIECPIGDFFCNSWNKRQDIFAIPFNVNPEGGFNCFMPMPFRKHVRITVENQSPNKLDGFFYAINYTLETVPAEALYFHAVWRRENPTVPLRDYVMADGIRGRGQYVGTFMSWQQNSAGWWGEGEIKMFLDGDSEHPTICGTGTEDYFGGAWGFAARDYSAPFMGFSQVSGKSDQVGCRMTLYRFHMLDPVYFRQDLKVTMQALGWRSEGRYLSLQDDIASVVYWYQTLPHAPLPTLPSRNEREII
jgi:hypothetical protein